MTWDGHLSQLGSRVKICWTLPRLQLLFPIDRYSRTLDHPILFGCPMGISKQCRVVHWTPIGRSWYELYTSPKNIILVEWTILKRVGKNRPRLQMFRTSTCSKRSTSIPRPSTSVNQVSFGPAGASRLAPVRRLRGEGGEGSPRWQEVGAEATGEAQR